jgi:hypothetical protein
MSEQSEALKERTMLFASSVLDLIDKLPDTTAGRVIAYQPNVQHPSEHTINLLATVDRELNFIAKLGAVVEEAEESVYWLEFARFSLGRSAPHGQTHATAIRRSQ